MAAKALSPKERQQRIEQGRRIRYEMERRGITVDQIMTHFGKSYPAVRMALRTPGLPSLRSKIERYVMTRKPPTQAACA